jgi:hypothetical protein
MSHADVISGALTEICFLQQAPTYVRTQLRQTCRTFGGKAVFGFDAHEIGNKSMLWRSHVALPHKHSHGTHHDSRALGLQRFPRLH